MCSFIYTQKQVLCVLLYTPKNRYYVFFYIHPKTGIMCSFVYTQKQVLCVFLYTPKNRYYVFFYIHPKTGIMCSFIYTQKQVLCVLLYTPKNMYYVFFCIHPKTGICVLITGIYFSVSFKFVVIFKQDAHVCEQSRICGIRNAFTSLLEF